MGERRRLLAASMGIKGLGVTGPFVVLVALSAAACQQRAPDVRPDVQPRSPAPFSRPYQWNLPPGFPRPLVPVDNRMSEAKVELGRRLFYDRRLSGNQTFSCASCHRQERAFSDGQDVAIGSTGMPHPRNAMALTNVAYNVNFNWADPRTPSLEEQARVPLFNRHPVELGLGGRKTELLVRLREDARYRAQFAAAFPESRPIRLHNVLKAIGAFERTLISGRSAYDRLAFLDESEALSAAARRGLRLFLSDRTRCSECHAGFNFSGPVVFQGAPRRLPEFHNTGLFDLDGRGAYPSSNRGILEFTGKKRDMGRFRAPTLRNIELTAPYMHDGSFETLQEVLDFYAAGGRGPGRSSPLKSDRVVGFELGAGEKQDLIEFLKSLTDRSFVEDPRFSDPG